MIDQIRNAYERTVKERNWWDTPSFARSETGDGYRSPFLQSAYESFSAGYAAASGCVPVDQWKIVLDEPVLIYVVHTNAEFESDEKRRKEMWEGWTVGRWIKNGPHASGWTYYGMMGKVTHVAPLPDAPGVHG